MTNAIIKPNDITALLSTDGELSESAIKARAKEITAREFSAKEKVTGITLIKAMQLYLEETKKNLKISKDDIELTGSVLGASIQYAATSTKYDYSSDFEWQIHHNALKLREDQLKAQNDQYRKHIEQGGTEADFTGIVDKGEKLPVVNKTQSFGAKITLAK